VVVYVESARPEPRAERELVQCVAVELSTGRHFERLVHASFGPPSPTHLAHMELSADDFGRAVTRDAFVTEFGAFLRDGGNTEPLLAAWNQATLDVLAMATGARASRVALKNAYRTTHGRGTGSLEDAVRAQGLDVAPAPCSGRAGRRLGQARAMAEHLHGATLGGDAR
jgi:hypothetical protein